MDNLTKLLATLIFHIAGFFMGLIDMKYKLAAVVGLGLLLSACMTTSDVYLPDGTQGKQVTCNGMGRNMGDCYKAAGEDCKGRGYVPITGEHSEGQFAMANVSANGGSASGGSVMSRSFMYKCK